VAFVPGLAAVPQAEWDALLAGDDAPLLSWGYLASLEEAGCVGPGTSWQPAHLIVREGPRLVAAAPAYLKADSDGEWVADWDWAEFAARLGLDYYPKLVLAVPFNPVTGRRLLLHPGLPEAERARLSGVVSTAIRTLCEQAGISSAHVLFPRDDELPLWEGAGFAARSQEQYHFLNPGYQTFADYLTALTHNRRRCIRRERRDLAAAGITVRTHRGPDGFTAEELCAVFDMYQGTSLRYTGGPPYLNRRFFQLCAGRLGDRLELVLARGPDGRLLGGAFNLRGDTRLYGRHWGAAGHVPFLHFEVCFYHSIERCIREGLRAFEPGHGGEQKLLRGFQPVRTYSAHFLRDRRLRQPIRHYLTVEAQWVDAALREARRRCPLHAVRATKDSV
jgi:hypothetical protein